MKKKQRKEKKKGDLTYRIVMTILIIIILFSLYKVGTILYGYYQGMNQYEDVQSVAKVEEGVDFEALQKINEDVKAWIHLEDTVIDYPVLQTTNNDYYLYHMFNGEENGAGSIFIDYRNETPFEEFNTILHGHRMKDGTMFKPLIQYRDMEFYEEHPVMEILTPEKEYDLHIFAVVTIPADSDLYQFSFEDVADKSDYLNRIASLNEITTDVQVGTDDRIVMMSTCTYEIDDGRLCVYGKLVPKE